MLCDKIIADRIQRNLYDPRISVVFNPFRKARSSDIYPTQATKQVRLVFRSLRRLIKGEKFEYFDSI